jgi:pilus assembly protein Flp/PilA
VRKAHHRLVSIARDGGASAVEYGLLVAAIASVVVGAVFGLGSMVSDSFDHTSSCVLNSGLPRPGC